MEIKECNIKLVKESEIKGLELLGAGRKENYKLYKFIKCGHEQEIQPISVRNGNPRCKKCFEQKLIKEANMVGLELLSKCEDPHYRQYKCKKCRYKQKLQISNVRKKNFRCNNCLEMKLNKEASMAGLELLGAGKDANYRIYKFDKCGHKQEIAITHVRNGNPRCKKCFEQKLIEEANLAGLKLIGAGKNVSYRLYKCKECEYVQEFQTTLVRKKVFKCEGCFEKKLNKEANLAGLELIEEGKNKYYRLYKFISCGHQQEIQTTQVRNGNVTCKICFDENLKNEANSNGLDLIKECENSDYRLYRFKKCKHEQEITIFRVRKGSFKCKICQENKFDEEAKNAQLKLLGAGKTAHYRLYKFIDCGHEQEIAIRHVRDQNFKCHECKGIWLKNGLLVESKLEQIVGNWLIDQEIKFKYGGYLSSKSGYKTDFYLEEKDIYIEVAGYITKIKVTTQNSIDEIIQQLRNDSDNYRNYRDNLIKKITNCYDNKNLIVMTSKNLRDKSWKDNLKINIELMAK